MAPTRNVFRTHGVSMQTIRRAARVASDLFGTSYPFALRRFDTDGTSIFATLEMEARQKEEPRKGIEALGRGQIVFEPFIRPFFHHFDLEGLSGEARR